MLVSRERLWRRPTQIFKVVDTAFDGREGSAFACQGNTRPHGMVTDEFHHLRAKLLPFLRTVAHTHVIH